MTIDIAIVIGVLICGFILFTTELFSIDVTAMAILTFLCILCQFYIVANISLK